MDEKFHSILSITLIPQVLDLIVKNEGMAELASVNDFYHSETYALLANEETKMWHFSPLTLYTMWKHEKETGKVVFPEE